MLWKQTYTGRMFFPLEPDPGAVVIEDVARSLAMQCRFNGHVRRYYSVAEHSVLVSRLVPEAFALEGLLHDAAEAYMGDLIRPLKQAAMLYAGQERGILDWRDVEAGVQAAVARAFGVPALAHPSVKQADMALLMAERGQLLGDPPAPWGTEYVRPADVALHCWGPKQAEEEFLARFRELRRRKEA
jgi:hypothetical protein